MHHLLHQGVAALLQPTLQTVAAAASQLVEASETMLDKHGRGAAPWWLVGHSSQDVIIIDSESVDCGCSVVAPESHAIYVVAVRLEETGLHIHVGRLEFSNKSISSRT